MSTWTLCPSTRAWQAALSSKGIRRSRAKAFPVPRGNTPNAVSEPSTTPAMALIVPSPPPAIRSGLFSRTPRRASCSMLSNPLHAIEVSRSTPRSFKCPKAVWKHACPSREWVLTRSTASREFRVDEDMLEHTRRAGHDSPHRLQCQSLQAGLSPRQGIQCRSTGNALQADARGLEVPQSHAGPYIPLVPFGHAENRVETHSTQRDPLVQHARDFLGEGVDPAGPTIPDVGSLGKDHLASV